MNPSIGDRGRVAERLAPVRRAFDRGSRWVDQQTAFRHRLSIRGRIALFGAAVVAVTVVIFSVLVYLVVENSLRSEERRVGKVVDLGGRGRLKRKMSGT